MEVWVQSWDSPTIHAELVVDKVSMGRFI